MNLDRGLQAAISIVVAFSMLWTIAILIPDKSSSHNPLSLTNDVGSSNDHVIHAEYPRIILKPSSRQKLRTSSKSTQASSHSRKLVESKSSVTQTQAMTTSQPTNIDDSRLAMTSQPTNTDDSQKHETKRLFPAYVWYITALFLYRSHTYAKKRGRKDLDYADESFFQKSGLDASLEYGSGLEYEDSDFLSVTSNYGSASRWTPDSLNKFDLELEYEMADSQI
eukprot:scaffold29912_cov67-Cyclotella_meneghiniana.AAC.12